MFIHWGLYALPARHEWVKNRERIPDEEYIKYFQRFNPDLYDPVAWARAAKNAGMKYFVITTKHHEGFCLWDTQQTDYKVTNTPYGKDLIGPMVEAFRAEGLRVGFYYSLIDWHHPEFPVDRVHPMAAVIAQANPLYHLSRVFRHLLLGGYPEPWMAVSLAVIAAWAFILSGLAHRWMDRRVERET